MSSGLRVSTGCRPQVFFAKDYCRGRARRTDGQYGLVVQFQQHRAGVRGGDLEGGFGGERAVLARLHFGVEDKRAVGENANAGGGKGGDGKIKRREIRRRRVASG